MKSLVTQLNRAAVLEAPLTLSPKHCKALDAFVAEVAKIRDTLSSDSLAYAELSALLKELRSVEGVP